MANSSKDQDLNRQLDQLLAAYRDACGDPEPSANFFPVLWDRIDARRNTDSMFRRWCQFFVAAAAAACLLFGALVIRDSRTNPAFPATTYVEALASSDQNTGMDIARYDHERTDAFPFGEEKQPQ
jgi:hypothetical protein